jgi:6-phosphogluconolactonase (cycloisomerase 2 family)
VDHLASQGSLTYDPRHRELYAVNAGSDSVSVFAVDGDRLRLRQVVSSRGAFPVSITVHDDAVYVLNARDGGSIQGYLNEGGRLIPIGGWNRSLGLDAAATPEFTHTPGQVAFTPDGGQLIVTTKANGNAIDVFGIGRSGRPSAAPVVNTEPGAVPFAVTFDRAGHLVVAEAGTNSLVTFGLNATGTLSQIDAVASTQRATCWVEPAGAYLFAGNAGGDVNKPGFGSLSSYTSSPVGQLTNLGATQTDPGTVDASATPDGRYLYTQTGAKGIVDEFAVNVNGSLTGIGSVSVADAVGGEGIVAL